MKLLFAAAIAAVVTTVGAPVLAQTAPAPAPSTSPAGKTASEENAQTALEKAGYTQVTNVKSSPEGVVAKAMKDGKEVRVVVDSAGKIKEQPPAQ